MGTECVPCWNCPISLTGVGMPCGCSRAVRYSPLSAGLARMNAGVNWAGARPTRRCWTEGTARSFLDSLAEATAESCHVAERVGLSRSAGIHPSIDARSRSHTELSATIKGQQPFPKALATGCADVASVDVQPRGSVPASGCGERGAPEL
jgi:hypothetical protein